MQRDLVLRSMEGDRSAFTELGRLWIDRLYAAARLILVDQHRAQDATQEALLSAWRDLKGLRDPDRFEPWLRRILVNACYREARKDQSWRRAQTRMEPIAGVAPDPADGIADRDVVDRAMSGLDPEQRTLVILHYYLRLPVSETALTLGIPVGTVKSGSVGRTPACEPTLKLMRDGPVPWEGRHDAAERLPRTAAGSA